MINRKAISSDGRSSDPKVVIFLPSDNQQYLEPFAAAGHKNIGNHPPIEITEEKSRRNSAVFTWLHQQANFEEDVYSKEAKWEEPPTPQPVEKQYHSIATVPIKCGNQLIGVLSITGKEQKAYQSKEMQEYIQLFANALSPLLYYYTSVLPQFRTTGGVKK